MKRERMTILMLIIAVLAIGISVAVLPLTVSLFSGEHRWYNLSGRGNQVPCEKCHADVTAEMESGRGPHSGETGYGRLKCDYCHRTFDLNDYGGMQSQNINQSIFDEYYYTYASGDGSGSTPGKEAHAASTVPCMYCHSGEDRGGYPMHDSVLYCSCHDDGGEPYYYHGDRFYTGTSNTNPGECIRCHPTNGTHVSYVPPAGGFGLTTNSADTGSLAAHRRFVLNAQCNDMQADANEACIACHTHMRVEMNFNVTSGLMLYVNDSYNLSSSYWNVTDISPAGYTHYREVKEG